MARSVFVPLFVLLVVAGNSLTLPSREADAQSPQSTYLVVYKSQRLPRNFASNIEKAGGTVAVAYRQIGVVTVHSASSSFEATMEGDRKVKGVTFSPTPLTAHGTPTAALEADPDDDPSENSPPSVPVSDADPLSGLQWDMRQIHVPEAHAITGGSPEVLVGDIDTGLDYTHPDIAPNVDFENSVSCVGGAPDQDPDAWFDRNGHGTHTAGTIAAAANGIGIVGIAPNVKIAAIKAGNDEGFFFPADVVCAFMWAGSHDVNVTNNSYFMDPWLFNCRSDPEQGIMLEAAQRAVRWAQRKGVLVVAAAGNSNIDLPHKTVDTISPDWPPGSEITRPVDSNCFDVPNELPGVVSVTANGNLMQKAYYSSYGLGVVELTAPGGDRRFQLTTDAPNGRVLSALPSALFDPTNPLMLQDCSVSPCATYQYAQGTSMAAPHVAGVAALIFSQREDTSPRDVTKILQDTADPVPCPPNPFNPGPPFTFEAHCEGDEDNNGFFGQGQVNAFAAISDGDGDDDDDDDGDHNGDRDDDRPSGRRDDD